MNDEPHLGLAVRDNDSVLVLSHARSEIVARGRRDAAELVSTAGQDCAKLVIECHKAAEGGNAQAQYDLGRMYFYGEGVRRDYFEAVRWYRKAAEEGFAQAQFAFGFMCEAVLEEYEEAVAWHRKAANQGLIDAQYKMGRLYCWGIGVRPDCVLAYMWFKIAEAGMSISGSLSDWTRISSDRDLVASRMTPEQIAFAQRLANDWAPTGGKGVPFTLSPLENPTVIRPNRRP